MYNLTQFVDLQNKALTDGDIKEAQRLLTELETHLERKQSWQRLRTNEPESYDVLYTELKDLSQVLSPAARSTMRQLIRIFQCCQDHSISLEFLDVPANLHKYREASSYLNVIITKHASDDEIKSELLEAIRHIKSDKNRDETRSWVRNRQSW